MATERFNKYKDRDEDRVYFNAYAQPILNLVRGKVLDIGCGEGWLTRLMADNAESIIAVDKFSDQPDENKADNIKYIKEDITNWTPKGEFDLIVSTEFIEHITQDQFEELLEKIKPCLKGCFVGSTPNVDSYSGNPFHLREYNGEQLSDVFKKHGYEVVLQYPIPYLTVFTAWLV